MEFWIGTTIALGSIAISLGIAWMQGRTSDIEVFAGLTHDGRPDALRCVIRNKGLRGATAVQVGFNRILPAQTQVFARPEIGATITEVGQLPHPDAMPNVAAVSMAFAVRIPVVPAKGTVEFEVRTVDADNRRAADQLMLIRTEQQEILREFGRRLNEKYPRAAVRWNLDTVFRAHIKSQNLFVPGHVLWEQGRLPVQFLTDDEIQARAANQDLYAQHKAEFIDIYQRGKTFTAPVVRIKTLEGERTWALLPPYVRSGFETPVKMPPEGTSSIEVPIPVPDKYEAEA